MADFNPPPPGENNDTGFGVQPNQVGERFVNRDGSFNIRKTGYPAWERVSVYSTLLRLPWHKFLGLLILTYFSINVLFTIAYLLVGMDELEGFRHSSWSDKLLETFFFSTQTFTTVGYGRVNPVGIGANIIASIETMMGWIFFALVTGMYYGRFTRPRAFLRFAEHALIAPYRGGQALMIRVAPFKDDHHLNNADLSVTAALLQDNAYHFYSLKLERNHVDALTTNWTIVHPINQESPLHGLNLEEMAKADLEVYVTLTGFDHIFSSTVISRTSYTFREIIPNARFLPMYHMSKDGSTTILELNKLGAYEKIQG